MSGLYVAKLWKWVTQPTPVLRKYFLFVMLIVGAILLWHRYRKLKRQAEFQRQVSQMNLVSNGVAEIVESNHENVSKSKSNVNSLKDKFCKVGSRKLNICVNASVFLKNVAMSTRVEDFGSMDDVKVLSQIAAASNLFIIVSVDASLKGLKRSELEERFTKLFTDAGIVYSGLAMHVCFGFILINKL